MNNLENLKQLLWSSRQRKIITIVGGFILIVILASVTSSGGDDTQEATIPSSTTTEAPATTTEAETTTTVAEVPASVECTSSVGLTAQLNTIDGVTDCDTLMEQAASIVPESYAAPGSPFALGTSIQLCGTMQGDVPLTFETPEIGQIADQLIELGICDGDRSMLVPA